MLKHIVMAVALLGIWLSAVFYISCEDHRSQQQSQSGAKQVSKIYQVPKNSEGNTVEQQHIIDRIRVTTDPTKILWIHLVALDGKIIRRMPVVSKVTSSGKRLEPRHAATASEAWRTPSYGDYYTDEFIQPDGTFGDSDSYIYWFDPAGRYNQYGTAGGIGYLLTDYPIDLVDPVDQVTGMYKVNQQAAEWQQQQEQKLKQH